MHQDCFLAVVLQVPAGHRRKHQSKSYANCSHSSSQIDYGKFPTSAGNEEKQNADSFFRTVKEWGRGAGLHFV